MVGPVPGPGPGDGKWSGRSRVRVQGMENGRAGPGSGSRVEKWRGSGSEVRARLDPQINSLLLDLFIGRKIV